MNFRKKTTNVTKVLYIILAMCIISIISLTLYSLFNRSDNSGNKILHISQEEEALENIFRRQEEPAATQAPPPATTQRPTAAPATAPPPASSAPEISAPSYLPEIEDEIEDVEVLIPAPAATTTAQPAFITPDDIFEDSIEVFEESIEVMSVPAIFRKPLNGFISKKHNPDVPEYSVAMNDYRTHTGIDIDAEIGAHVKAVAAGVISEIKDDPLMGKTVVISHAGGITSVYMNLQSAVPQNITAGAEINAGDVIGGVGQTSLIEMADVPHLHFEMRLDGVNVDPFDFIDFN